MSRVFPITALAATFALHVPAAAAAAESFLFGPFGQVSLYAPAGAPQEVVLFLSGDGGWNLGVIAMAERLSREGALVAGVDTRAWLRNLQRSRESCLYPPGDLERLSRAVQLRRRLPSYKTPILAGYSSGATVAYAALAAAPPETFAGAISLGFCPDLQLAKPLCRSRGLSFRPRALGMGFDLEPARSLSVPWIVLQGDIDRVCSPASTRSFVAEVAEGKLVPLPRVGHGFAVTRNWGPQLVEAYRQLTGIRWEPPPPASPAVEDLPLIEVPEAGPSGDLLAVVLSGDGGWAEIDKGMARSLSSYGVPVVGWNSLRYYWTPRTPDRAAADLARILDHYLAAWGKRRVLLIGYSFGADVLPFLAARLKEPLRSRVAAVALLGLSRSASFEFHVSEWLRARADAQYPTLPEVQRLTGLKVLCVHGEEEQDSACRSVGPGHAEIVALPGGHHFAGHYEELVQALLRRVTND